MAASDIAVSATDATYAFTEVRLGLTPAAYAQSLRLQAARRLITDTRHSLTDIALRTGFSSQSALSRAFRQHFGTPPSALRRT